MAESFRVKKIYSKSTNTADFYFASEFENENDSDGLVPEFFKEKKL
jgi:hypothetical protein